MGTQVHTCLLRMKPHWIRLTPRSACFGLQPKCLGRLAKQPRWHPCVCVRVSMHIGESLKECVCFFRYIFHLPWRYHHKTDYITKHWPAFTHSVQNMEGDYFACTKASVEGSIKHLQLKPKYSSRSNIITIYLLEFVGGVEGRNIFIFFWNCVCVIYKP